MTQDEKQAIALFRYSIIAPIVTCTLEPYKTESDFFQEASEKSYVLPNGTTKQYSKDTIYRWHRTYLKEGFDGLLPKGRADRGHSRTLDSECQEFIRHMKETYPRMPATVIYQQMLQKGLASKHSFSESTVSRFVANIKAEKRLTTNKDMRRYERPHINEVWCGDSSVGPRLLVNGVKKKIYIIALIDDASRFIVGIDAFFNDTYINLMSVIKSAISTYGRPKIFNFDNGSAYRNKQMELLAARIGSTINYCQPYTPTSKAKIERWFRTMKDQWMATLDMHDFHTLEEFRESLFAYVHTYNNTPHSSLNGKTPSERFFQEPDYIFRLTDEQIEKSFLLEIERTVSSDSVVVIDHVEYEVDYRFAKRRIRIRYSPDLEKIFIVEFDGTLVPIRLLNKHDNAMIKREKVHLCKGEI